VGETGLEQFFSRARRMLLAYGSSGWAGELFGAERLRILAHVKFVRSCYLLLVATVLIEPSFKNYWLIFDKVEISVESSLDLD
jgi:hypothetical protein